MSERRSRTDSAAGNLEIMQGALSGPPEPPECVKISKSVRPFWDLVTTAKAKRAWTDNDLVLAADVSRVMYRLECSSRRLERLYSADNDEDQDAIKELEKVADMMAKRVKLLCAHLQIHSEATQGKSRDQVKANEKHKDGLDVKKNPNSLDDLIPTGNPQ